MHDRCRSWSGLGWVQDRHVGSDLTHRFAKIKIEHGTLQNTCWMIVLTHFISSERLAAETDIIGYHVFPLVSQHEEQVLEDLAK
jgi:hypothetical protein